MKAKFIINRLGAEEKSDTLDNILSKEILDDIALRCINSTDYDVVWKEERIKGKLIKLETKDKIFYINLSINGHIESRNSFFQSIPTALGIYLIAQKEEQIKKCYFYFYFLPFSGNALTPYFKFLYRVMRTAGINFLNLDKFGSSGVVFPFKSINEMIKERNSLKKKNSGNNSTFLLDEGQFYHIYGKTFGANQKETTLFCFAVSAITDKPVKLFQIIDNNSKCLSKNDIKAINNFSLNSNTEQVEVLDDSFEFENIDSNEQTENLRNVKFIYNLLSKYGGEKKCALCGCKISNIVQGAHIYPVADIKKRNDLSYDEKLALAVDGDNGIWLCENHHKLFDSGLINFDDDGNILYSKELNDESLKFVKEITTIEKIDDIYINDKMLSFFDLRYGKKPRVNILNL